MNEIGFISFPSPPGFLCFDHEDALNGISKILLVEDFDHLRYLFKTIGLAPWIEEREKYQTYDEFVEDRIEGSITHETLHYLILTREGKTANRGLDYIDCTPEGYRCLR